MAAATVAARTEYATTSAGTSATPTFTQTTGDLVVIFISTAVSTALTSISDGFTNFTNLTGTFHILYKTLAGTEGGDVTMTITSSKVAAVAYNIQGHCTTIAPEISTVATATSVNPNATTVTPAAGFAKNFLWISAFGSAGEEADDDTWCTAAPTNFTNLLQKTSGTAGVPGVNTSIASAEFSSSATSMDAAAFTMAQSLLWRAYTVAITPKPTGALTGTITASVNETDIVAGGKTAILTLSEDRWIAAGAASFDLQRDEIIAGFDSAQAEATGWDAVPKATQTLGGVVRTSDTVVTVTWDAFATYNITAQETVTVSIPSTSILSAQTTVVTTPTFTVSITSAIKTVKGLARASVKTIKGLALASVKTIKGLA